MIALKLLHHNINMFGLEITALPIKLFLFLILLYRKKLELILGSIIFFLFFFPLKTPEVLFVSYKILTVFSKTVLCSKGYKLKKIRYKRVCVCVLVQNNGNTITGIVMLIY